MEIFVQDNFHYPYDDPPYTLFSQLGIITQPI